MGEQKYTRADVAGRSGRNGAPLWIIIKDAVYDVSAYLREHPGGEDALQEHAGKDATKDFEAVGHSDDAKDIMKKFRVGEIVEKKKAAASGPAKPSNKILPPIKPPGPGGPPPNKSKNLSSGPPMERTSGLPPLSCAPDMATRGLLEAPADPSVVMPREPTLGATSTSLSETNSAPGGSASLFGLTIASIKPASGAPNGPVTVSSAQTGEAMSSNSVVLNESTVPSNIRDDVSPNSKFTEIDSSAAEGLITSSSEAAQDVASNSLSTPRPTSVVASSKSVQAASPTVLQGLAKVSLTSSKPITKQALPWSSFSPPGKQKTSSSFSSSMGSSTSKTKLGQHDPFKNNKIAGGLIKK